MADPTTPDSNKPEPLLPDRTKDGRKWVKRRLKSGKWYQRNRDGSMTVFNKGDVVTVPETFADSAPDQFGYDDTVHTVTAEPNASVAPAVGAKLPVEAKDLPETPPPEEVAPPLPSLPTGAPLPADPIESVDSKKEETVSYGGPKGRDKDKPSSGPDAARSSTLPSGKKG